ncbi:MAG: aminotransferase class I/II-fold pyridoxal phosphate-dependent enzyme [Phaeodactylibacter sp.]|nr:aminotransferase class I/II-fold pyridoxal phosphate-dependent enzyme [Phaeodactylibacter sp.]
MTKPTTIQNDLIIRPASRLGEVKEYYFSMKLREIARMRAEGKPVLNLGIGSPDLPPAQEVVDELSGWLGNNDVHGYQSYTGIPELRQAFAGWYAQWFGTPLDPEGEVLPLLGSKEGLMHIAMSFLEAGDEALVPNPGYPAYRAVSNLAGAAVREYPLEERLGWMPDLEALGRQDLSRVKVMWANYPNMPTGTQAPQSFLEELVAFARRHRILVVNDNPYAFILNREQRSILSVPGAREVALELNSLSKAHNMAGWRIGMLAGREDYLKVVLRFKSNMDSGMFKPVQLAAVKALQSPPEWYASLNAVYSERRESVFQLLDLLGCTYEKRQVGMFVWAKVPDRYASGYELSDEVLYNHHVFLTPGGIFGSQGDQYIRISLCSDGALYEEAIRRIKRKAPNTATP